MLPDELTISESADLFLRELERGGRVKCPCCQRTGGIVRRHLTNVIAKSLVWLVCEHEFTDNWVYVPEAAPHWVSRQREWGRLRYWCLAERKVNDDKHKRTSGIWRPTTVGIDFARGKIAVPRFVDIYDDTVLRRSRELVRIDATVDERFSYDALTRAYMGA